jgi:hypothetical protein
LLNDEHCRKLWLIIRFDHLSTLLCRSSNNFATFHILITFSFLQVAAAKRLQWRNQDLNPWQGVTTNCRMVVADCLVANPARVNYLNGGFDHKGKWRREYTPLMLSCVCQNLEIFDFLLRSGADVNAKGGS